MCVIVGPLAYASGPFLMERGRKSLPPPWSLNQKLSLPLSYARHSIARYAALAYLAKELTRPCVGTRDSPWR